MTLFARLVRAVVSFALVLTAYAVYALVAVPLIEPAAEGPKRRLTPEELAAADGRVDHNQDLLKPYFPPGSWELQDPKVLESDRTRLLIKEYHTLPDGRVQLFPCTVLFMPDDAGTPGGGKPIIMQAPEGAILQFDTPFDLKRAKIGRLVGGVLVGRITIRREPSRPGAADDLRINTRDVELREERITTPHPVDFHFGPNYGSGREMIMTLTRPAKSGDGKALPSTIGGVKTFELVHDVRVHMLPDGKHAQRVPKGASAPAFVLRRPPSGSEPPLEVTCQGPFRFDVARSLATFTRQVDVLRLNHDGPSDQLNCELLSIFFAPRADKTVSAKPPALSAESQPVAVKQPRILATNLEPRMIEARGDPVIVRSPASGSTARCQRLEYEMKSGRIVLDGPGTLDGAMPRNAAQKFMARWTRQLKVEPQGADQLLSLVGAAQVRMTDLGRTAQGPQQPASLSAEVIHAWLRQPPRADPHTAPLPNIAFGSASAEGVRLQRLLAEEAVVIDSAQLTGATTRLEAWFDEAAAPSGEATAAGSPSPSVAGPAAAVTRPAAGKKDDGGQSRYHVDGSLLRIRFAVKGEVNEVSEVLVEGNAKLVETQTARREDKPLMVKGHRLHVTNGDTPQAKVSVVGQPGYVEARGMSLSGANIDMERASNRVWVDGPGRMTLPMNRDPLARPGKGSPASATPGGSPLEITWQRSMQFDGRTAIFEQTVAARSPQQLLRTERMEATLKRTIDFSSPPAEGARQQSADLDQLVCKDGVFIENRGFDEQGLQSIDRLEAKDLALNQTTGGIDAHGPGWMSSVRRGAADTLLPAADGARTPTSDASRKPAPATPAKPKTPATRKPGDKDALSYLHVIFARSITGNMHRREVTLTDQVKTIYGPVKTWEEKLDGEHPEQLGPQGGTMTCDQLTVREMPGAGREDRGWLELEALGNTLVEGSGFTARAHRLTFAEEKTLLVLEGDGRGDAQLFRQPVPGGPTSEAKARRIKYWQATNRVEVQDARFFDFGQFNNNSKPAPDKKNPPASNKP